jgi:hypothetical protein
MADAQTKTRAPRIDPEREMAALEAIKASIAAEIEGDPEFLLDVAEGETNLLEALDALIEADLFDDSMLEGISVAEHALAYRKQRFETRRRTRRAIMERALVLLDQKRLERPAATLTLTERAPKVEIDDESALPSRFFRTPDPVVDKKAIKQALDADEEVPGAHMSNSFISLTVRRR